MRVSVLGDDGGDGSLGSVERLAWVATGLVGCPERSQAPDDRALCGWVGCVRCWLVSRRLGRAAVARIECGAS